MKKIFYMILSLWLIATISSCTHTSEQSDETSPLPEPQIAEETDEIIPQSPELEDDSSSDENTWETEDDIEVEEVDEPIIQANQQEVYTIETSAGNTITIDNFWEMQLIDSPLVITGTVPTSWVFEWIFSANLYTDRGELIKEWYGSANIFTDEWEIFEWPASFEINMEFDIPSPEQAETGKLRLADDNPSWLPQNQDLVEIQVLFP